MKFKSRFTGMNQEMNNRINARTRVEKQRSHGKRLVNERSSRLADSVQEWVRVVAG